MASPVRLLHRVQVVLALLHFAVSVLITFPHGNSGGNGSLRACSSTCDWVCNRSRCACSLILHFVLFLDTNKISLSCDNDVGNAGEVEHEERADKTLDNEEHEILRIVLNFLH